MAGEFQLPDNEPVVNQAGQTTIRWAQWLAWIHRSVTALRSYGPSDGRPTTFLWPGRTYFDTDLGIPIYVQQVSPVVWIDALANPA